MARPTFERGAKIGRWEKNLGDPRRALKQIGALMVAESQRAFREQAWDGRPWQPRANPNVFGIISDFSAGRKAPPGRRFQERPALVDTGRLRSSISFRLTRDAVEVGSSLEHASVLHGGGKVESETITESVQRGLGAWLEKQDEAMRSKLGWLLSERRRGTKLSGTVPARPFVGITRQLLADVRELVGVTLVEAK